jgi:alanine-synthesizing transaminase
MFSSRTRWNTAPNKLTQLLRTKRLQRESIIDLTESNPTRCGFSYPADDVLAAMADPSILSYQPEPFGLQGARKAVAEYYSPCGTTVDPNRIILTASTSEAYTFLLKLLCNTGDNVIVPQPSYPLFEYLCRLNDVELRHYRLIYDGEWRIDFESLRSTLTERTRAIVVLHPNNPTGSYVKQHEFDAVCRLAMERDCAIIADEVFGLFSIAPDGSRANVMSCDKDVLLFSLNGISKLLAFPQLKLSWIVVGGRSPQAGEALDRLEVIADTYLSVNTPVQAALPGLFRHLSLIAGQVCARVRENYELTLKLLSRSTVSVYYLEGGWYAILRLPGTKSDEEWATELLEQSNIVLYPGHFFSFEQGSSLVLSLILPRDVLESGLKGVRQFVEENA